MVPIPAEKVVLGQPGQLRKVVDVWVLEFGYDSLIVVGSGEVNEGMLNVAIDVVENMFLDLTKGKVDKVLLVRQFVRR